jgi:ribosomal protein S12
MTLTIAEMERERAQRNKGCTYKEPNANINMIANLLLKLRRSPFNYGIRSKIITMSSKIPSHALENIIALKLIQFPFTLIS